MGKLDSKKVLVNGNDAECNNANGVGMNGGVPSVMEERI